jgi:hypothetical protein
MGMKNGNSGNKNESEEIMNKNYVQVDRKLR